MNHEAGKLHGEIVEIYPVMIVQLPNRPSWQDNEPKYKDYMYSLGRDILDTNTIELHELNLKIDPTKAPDLTKEILGLSDEEKEQVFAEGLETNEVKERFLVARFVKDVLDKHIRKEAIGRIIRSKSSDYDNRNMLQMMGDGDGARLVGLIYDLHGKKEYMGS